MAGEVAVLAAEAAPFVAAYGAAVLEKTKDDLADGTVGVGKRLLHLIFGRKKNDGQLPDIVVEAVENPGDNVVRGALEYTIRKALENDAQMLAEVREILASAAPTAGEPGPGCSGGPPVRPVLPLMDRADQRRRTMSRCQRRMVSGVTSSRSPWRRALGITPSRVANSARSAQSTVVRRGCRRCRTASWWRRIKISAVFHASSRRDSRSPGATRVIRRNTNRRHMIGDHHGRCAASNSAGQRGGRDSRHAQAVAVEPGQGQEVCGLDVIGGERIHRVTASGQTSPGPGSLARGTHVRQLQLPPDNARYGEHHGGSFGDPGGILRLIPVSASILHSQLKTSNRFLEIEISF